MVSSLSLSRSALPRHVMFGGLDQTARVDGRAVEEVEDRRVLELALS